KAVGIAAAKNRRELQDIDPSPAGLPSSAPFSASRFLSEIRRSAKRTGAAARSHIRELAEAAARPSACRKTCKSCSRRCLNYHNFGIESLFPNEQATLESSLRTKRRKS